MYIVRDIFHLEFGHFRHVKQLLDEAYDKKLFPGTERDRILSDFTGTSYRVILESPFETLAEYETMLTSGMANAAWQEWYNRLKAHVRSSEREILKVVR
ncbi:MAG TPA: hypothetical protein VFW78_03735 [Bacteroidia bacterium]|nr:hypothetical protein [Bacteroidia bacterium]